jgi:hypothetical protein
MQMKEELKKKFYEFNQNNSGGSFDVDENVCHRVIIEATDANHALAIFEPMIENQSGSCPCCGDRWYTYDPDEINLDEWKEKGYSVGVYSHYPDAEQRWFKLYGEFPRIEEPTWKTKYSSKEFTGKIYFENIEQYCQFMANAYGWTVPDIRIHFLDGTKKEIFI